MKLSDQQYQVMQALWELGEASTRDVQQRLKHLSLAHTTVATILSRMEKKGLLSSEVRGRERIYKPLVNMQDVNRSMISSLVTTLFDGNSKELIAHLVEEGQVTDEVLEEARSLLRQEKDKAHD